MREKLQTASCAIVFAIVMLTLTNCGKTIGDAQDFKPNRAPVITSFSATDISGRPLDQSKIVNGMIVRIAVDASDPEDNSLTYDFTSECASFSGLKISDTGCTVNCFPQGITAGAEVAVKLSVRDDKNASVTRSLFLGTGKLGPALTINTPYPPAIKSSETTSFTFSSTSDGYYRLVEIDDIPNDTAAENINTLIATYKASTDPAVPALATVSASSVIGSIIKLSSGEGVKKVWVVFWDAFNRYDYNYVPIVVDDTAPVVSSHIPADNASHVPSSTTVSFSFADIDELDTTSIEEKLSLDPSAGVVIGSPVYSNKTISYSVSGLTHGLPYKATLSAGIRDRAGNTLNTATTVSFSTELSENTKMIVLPGRSYFCEVATPTVSGISPMFPTGANDASFAAVPAPFVMAETEATYRLWKEVYDWATTNYNNTGKRKDGGELYIFANPGTKGSKLDSGSDSDMQPVTNVNWRDAIVWCNALTEYYNVSNGSGEDLECIYFTDSGYTTPLRESTNNTRVTYSYLGTEDCPYLKASSKGFRLPTNNEYEFAARYIGATKPLNTNIVFKDGVYYTNGESASGSMADANNTSVTAAVAVFNQWETAVVKSKTANALGLYDMSGNVSEWCFDYAQDIESSRVIRGGSKGFGSIIMICVGYERNGSPDSVTYDRGFRFVRSR